MLKFYMGYRVVSCEYSGFYAIPNTIWLPFKNTNLVLLVVVRTICGEFICEPEF